MVKLFLQHYVRALFLLLDMETGCRIYDSDNQVRHVGLSLSFLSLLPKDAALHCHHFLLLTTLFIITNIQNFALSGVGSWRNDARFVSIEFQLRCPISNHDTKNATFSDHVW